VLAVSDSGFHVTHAAYWMLQTFANIHCIGWEWLVLFVCIGTYASLLFEICLALLFLLQSFRCTKAISTLKYSPLVVLPVSAALALLEPSRHERNGLACVGGSTSSPPFVSLTVVSFCVSVTSLTLGAIVSIRTQTPDIVKKRALQRVMAYVFNAVVTEWPLALFFIALNTSMGYPFWIFALCCQACNGILNAVVFFGQSRYASESIHQVDHQADKQSFAVTFAESSEDEPDGVSEHA
jgi:hypothetical protein